VSLTCDSSVLFRDLFALFGDSSRELSHCVHEISRRIRELSRKVWQIRDLVLKLRGAARVFFLVAGDRGERLPRRDGVAELRKSAGERRRAGRSLGRPVVGCCALAFSLTAAVPPGYLELPLRLVPGKKRCG
jgi:putative component of toxin-antitoxin plasmid stabilization module